MGELYQTEARFVSALLRYVRDYLKPLPGLGLCENPWETLNGLSTVRVLAAHTALLEGFRSALFKNTIRVPHRVFAWCDDVVDVFLELAPRLEGAWREYFTTLRKLHRAVARLRLNRAFVRFEASRDGHECTPGQTEAYITGRVPRYTLLLRDLQKRLPVAGLEEFHHSRIKARIVEFGGSSPTGVS